MKYVIFKYASLYMPVIIPDCVTHSQIKIKGAKPISAGFFKIDDYGSVKVYGESESLKLKPEKRRDQELIWKTLHMGDSTSAFLIYNNE